MKRNRLFQECVLFVIIAFALTTVNFFAIQESSAHQLCSGCPTEDSGETYCYDCNSEHNHLEEAEAAFNSAISSARSLITNMDDLRYEVESSTPTDVFNEIGAGLFSAVVSLTGAVTAALSAKAALASGGLLTAPALWGLSAGISGALSAGQQSYNHFSNAWSIWQYHNADVPCPECGKPATQAELDGNSPNMYHAVIHCMYPTNDRSNCYLGPHDISLRGVYRNCRGQCPNFANHYDTD